LINGGVRAVEDPRGKVQAQIAGEVFGKFIDEIRGNGHTLILPLVSSFPNSSTHDLNEETRESPS
jgi:hypothetical protein